MISIVLTFLITSVAWYSVWLWYRPIFMDFLIKATVAKCHVFYQEALARMITGTTPIEDMDDN